MVAGGGAFSGLHGQGQVLAPSLKPVRWLADRASRASREGFVLKGSRAMKKVAGIGPSGAAVAAVLGSVLLSLLILAPSPEVPSLGAVPVGPGHVDALFLPRPHVEHSLVHRVQSTAASAPIPRTTGSPTPHAPNPPHRSSRTHVSKPAATTPTATTPAATPHVPGSEHHGKPDWAAHPHGGGAKHHGKPDWAAHPHGGGAEHHGKPDWAAHPHSRTHHAHGREK